MRSRFSRRWRSVSFRSGLWSALSVGVVSVLLLLGLLFLAFALFAVSDGIVQASLLDRADDQIRLGVEPDELDLPTLGEVKSVPADEAQLGFWAVLKDDVVVSNGDAVFRSVIDADFSDSSFGASFEATEGKDEVGGVKRVDDLEWLVIERTVRGPDGDQYQVVVASEGVFSFTGFVVSSLPVTIPVVILLMSVAMAVTSYLMRRALRRVERMRSEVEKISQESLDRRVPLVDADDGIDKLAITMNDMLERLEQSDGLQRQFLADASHELRSPVAGLLAQLEVASAYPDRVDSVALLPKLHGEVERLHFLVNDLLFLSRSEAGESLALVRVDVDGILERETANQTTRQDNIAVEVTGRSASQVLGSASDLERMVRNLVDNAVRHAESRVELSATQDQDSVTIVVSDDGPGVPDDDRERIFDRFVRLDEARSRDSGGSGLGLAITRDIARKLGGQVSIVPSNSGAQFEVQLPVAT